MEKSPSIIFIDEIDAIGRKRGSGIGGGNDEREQTLNQLLTEIDGFAENSGVIVIAATNRPDVLDNALIRPGRFDRKIEIGLPDRKGRLEILSVHARTKPLSEDVSLNAIALNTSGFSGADLSNLLNESAIIAARSNKTKISNIELNQALDKLTMGLIRNPLTNSSNKRIIAYNEVGKALVSFLIPTSEKLDKVSILPRSSKLGGYTRFTPDEELLDSGLITKRYLLSRLIRTLAGRAAEILVFGNQEITQVSINEISAATDLAREMITKYGFSKLGPVCLEMNQEEVFIGRSLISPSSSIAQKTITAIDQEVILLSKYCLEKAINLLKPFINEMDLMVNVLLEEETVSIERFTEVTGIEPQINSEI